MDIKKDTIKSVKWSAVGQYSNVIIGFVLGIILARLLTPADFGTIGMIEIFFALANILTDSGFGAALIQKKDADEVDYSTVFFFNIVLSLFCYTLLYLCAPFIALFFKMEQLVDIVRVSALSLIIGAFCNIQINLLTKRINFKTPAIINLSTQIVSGCIAIVLAFMGYGVWTLVYQSLIASLLKTIAFWTLSDWRPKWIFSWASFRGLFDFGSKLLVSNLLASAYNNVTPLLIGKYYTPQALGFYSKAKRLVLLPSETFYGIMGKVTFPILSKIQDDDEQLIHVYSKFIRICSLPIFFVMMLMAAMAKPLIIFLYTDKWLESVVYVQILCFMTFRHVSQINLNLLLVKGRSDLNLKIEIYKKIVWLTLMLLSLPFGVLYFCIASVLGSQISLFINCYYTGRLFGLTYRKQWADFFPYFGLAILSCLPTYILTFLDLPNIVQIILGSSLSFSIYFGLLWIRKDDSLLELIRLTPAKKWLKIK